MSSGQKGESSAALADTRPDEGVNARARRPSGGSAAVNATLAAAMGIQPPKIALSAADQRRVSRVSQMRANPASPRPSAAEEELASLKEQQQALTRRISQVQEELGLQGNQAGAAGAKKSESPRLVASSSAESVSSLTGATNGSGRDLDDRPNARGSSAGPAEAKSPTRTRPVSPLASPKSQKQEKSADVPVKLSALFCMQPRESKDGAPAGNAPWSGLEKIGDGLEKMFRPPSFGLKDLAERSGLKKPSSPPLTPEAAQAEALRRGTSADPGRDLSPEAEAMRHRRSDTLSADVEVGRPKSAFEKAKSIGDMGLGKVGSMFEKARSSMSKDEGEGDSPQSRHWVPSPVHSEEPAAATAASQPWTNTPPPLRKSLSPVPTRKAPSPVGAVAQVARNTPACYLLFTETSGGAFLTHWSMDPVPGALAGFFPGKPVPSFKFTTGGGVSEMSRGVGGPNKKPFYAGWASFIKHAHSHQGTFVFYSNVPSTPVAIYLCQSDNGVLKVPRDAPVRLSSTLAFAVLPMLSMGLNVLSMNARMFTSIGEKEGAAISLDGGGDGKADLMRSLSSRGSSSTDGGMLSKGRSLGAVQGGAMQRVDQAMTV